MLDIIQLSALEDNYIYILHETVSGLTAAVDPALASPVLALLEQRQWSLDYILNTHHHWDHVGANAQLKQVTGCTVAASSFDQTRIPCVDIALASGEQFQLGAACLEIIATPGHTLGHIAYYNQEAAALFCGDTLFGLGCGRLFEGSAEQLWQSLQKLTALPPDTRVFCAHEYTQQNGRFALSVEPDNARLQARMQWVEQRRRENLTTIPSRLDEELATNPFLRPGSPSIRQRLDMPGATPLAVFTQLRQLKDNF